MGIASLIFGVIAAIFGNFVFLTWLSIWPAIVGVVLGAIAFGKARSENQPIGIPLAALILSAVAMM